MTAHRILQDALIADYEIRDPGPSKAINIDRDRAVVVLETAAAETRTLAAPLRAGIVATLCLSVGEGDCVVTVAAAVNQAANTVLTFADAGDEITLRAIRKGSAFVWRVASNDGVALS